MTARPAAPPGRRRVQQRALDTRAQILDAAVACLIEHGYAGTSTLAIQRRAGVSRGGLLHHYGSRDDLLVAAVEHLAHTRIGAVPADPAGELAADPGRRIDRAVAGMWATHRQDYFWAAVELWLAARHNPELRAALTPAERRIGADVRVATDQLFGAELAAHPDYPALRERLTTGMRGVALTYAFRDADPQHEPALRAWQADARRTLLSA